MIKYVAALLLVCCALTVHAQTLEPGFDKAEYTELMKISSRTSRDSAYASKEPLPEHFKMVYQSPVIGLDNAWDLWSDKKRNIAAISIRGTTTASESWLANFYAGMVPAKGALQLDSNSTFNYELATDPRAAVHVGWLVCMGYLGRDILPKIDSAYKAGTKDFLIVGHSQGGAIAYLLTAWLRHLQVQQKLATDIYFKTYCSAAPKPGNIFFAYDYENLTQNGWAYNVVNASDWVPQTPFSIQTLDDFVDPNPFTDATAMIKKQKFPKNIAMRHVYNRLNNTTKRAKKVYIKYLGNYTGSMVKRYLPGFVAPQNYFNSQEYVRTGNTITLIPDSAYYKLFPEQKGNYFSNHLHAPYMYLTAKYNSTNTMNLSSLTGRWQMNYITGKKIAFEGLYPDKKPVITFDASTMQVAGNTSCNGFGCGFYLNGDSIEFKEPFISTMMACPGEGEQAFKQTLLKINRYSVDGDKLYLYHNDLQLMRFQRIAESSTQ